MIQKYRPAYKAHLLFAAQEEKKTTETSKAGAIPKQDFLKVLRKKKLKGEIGMEYRVSTVK